jgi:hypothetical protein
MDKRPPFGWFSHCSVLRLVTVSFVTGLASNAAVAQQAANGKTPQQKTAVSEIHWAAGTGDVKIVETLLKQHPDLVSSKDEVLGETPFTQRRLADTRT